MAKDAAQATIFATQSCRHGVAMKHANKPATYCDNLRAAAAQSVGAGNTFADLSWLERRVAARNYKSIADRTSS